MELKKECTVKELCERYNLSRTTIERYMKYKNLPFKKVGRNIIFVIDDVEEWFKNKNKEIKYNYDDKEKQ